MEKRKGKGYWCYLVPKRRKPSRNRVGMELGTCYIPGSHGGDTQQRLLLCFSAVHHWEQPMWSLSSWLVSVKGLTWGPAGAHLNCWKHEEGRKGEEPAGLGAVGAGSQSWKQSRDSGCAGDAAAE